MPQPRRTAWVLITTLAATIGFAAAPSGVTLAKVPTPALCPDGMPTQWTDDVHPPNTVRVLRAVGPLKGKVETVPMWKYVGTVLRAEYSTGGSKPYPWMHVGALTVRQYAWYYAKNWRGGKVTYTNPNDPNDTITECYDLKDSTADQIYHPEKRNLSVSDPNDPNYWIPANVPTPANLQAMRQTWHMSLRKWQPDKNQSRLFLTGYRSGKKKPCGTDSTGFKIYQKSLRDCGNKNLTLEETLRRYFEANMLFVNNRTNDIADDGNDWRGDLGILSAGSGGSTDARIYKGTVDSFANGGATNFAGVAFSSIIGQGVGNVDYTALDGANDSKLFADLLMLVNTGGSGRQLLIAKSNGSGFAAPSSVDAPNNADRLLVGDFNGDQLTDAGFMVTEGSTRKLIVKRALQGGGFGDAADWWSAPVDTNIDSEMAGDVNGDGKTDLIMHNTNHVYSVATSFKSCSDFSVYGPCPAGATGGIGLSNANVWASPSWSQAANEVQNVVGDWNRDGRDDVIAFLKNGTGTKVVGLRTAVGAELSFEPQELWNGSLPFSARPQALNINPDGMADLALAYEVSGATTLTWLRSIERSVVPASMTTMSSYNTGLTWGASNRTF